MNVEKERAAFEAALSKKPEAMFWNASDAMFWAWQAARKCDGNHGGPRCADPECWNDSPQPSQIDRQGRGEPVAWQNTLKPCEIYTDDDLEPVWKGIPDFRPLYAAPQAAAPVGETYTMEALAPGAEVKTHARIYKPMPAGTKLYAHPQPAEPVKVPSDVELLDFYHARTKNEIRHSERTILPLFQDLLARYGQPAQPAASVEPCHRCLGTGTITVLSDSSPYAHDVDVDCDQCRGSGAVSDAAKYLAADLADEKRRHMDMWAEYRNFHRSLCQRFGYSHDAIHFRRDLVSLEEAIAAKIPAAHVAAQPSVHVEQIQLVLDKDQDAMQDAYNNGYQECCGRGVGGECCGNPDVSWSKEDQRIMDALNPIQRDLSALLDRIDTQAAEIARLRGACEKAIEWLEGWASAEPYLSELRTALAQEQS